MHRRTATASIRSRGVSLVWISVAMVILTAFASLGVDLARVHLAKTELQRAADAAARAGVVKFPDRSAVRTEAGRIAEMHEADGSKVVLQSADVQFGAWDATRKTLNTASTSPNAVRIIAARTASRGNGVPLMFGSLLRLPSIDVAPQATALIKRPPPGYGIVGLDSVDLVGVARIDSYRADAGAYGGANRRSNGSVASNGLITTIGASRIEGSADSALGTAGTGGANAQRKGTLEEALYYPPRTSGGNDGRDGDFTGTTLAAGTYYFRNFQPARDLVATGVVTVYVSGTVAAENVTAFQCLPSNFKLIVTSNSPVGFTGNRQFYADVYAPLSAVTVGGTGDFYGQIVGKTVRLHGNAGMHYDESMPSSGVTTISLVE